MIYKDYILNILTEINFRDISTKGFLEFYDKYKKKKTDKSLYVQFTSKDSIYDKTYVKEPSHNDPTGVYGYPLNYVINHPADLRYGTKSNYIRILQLKQGANILHMDWLREVEVRDVVRRYTDTTYDEIKKYMKYNQHSDKKTTPGQIFMFAIQHKFPFGFNGKKNKRDDLENVKPEDQNKLLQRMGYDVVIDEAKSANTASINAWEPNQIIFLNRKYLEIVDIFRNDISEIKQGVSTTPRIEDRYRKIANAIFSSIGDKIVSFDKRQTRFYSVKNRVLYFEPFTQRDYTPKYDYLGYKEHKATKTGTTDQITFSLRTEYGDHQFVITRDDTLEEIGKEVSEWFNSVNTGEPIVQLTNQKEFEAKQKEEEKERIIKNSTIQNKKRADETKLSIDLFENSVADVAPFKWNLNTQEDLISFDGLFNITRSHKNAKEKYPNWQSHIDFMKEWREIAIGDEKFDKVSVIDRFVDFLKYLSDLENKGIIDYNNLDFFTIGIIGKRIKNGFDDKGNKVE